ncbi:MAG: tRNA (N(6)-L-threonylcarbamoyladenosine(37)-C(2))-methylthiotransferase MtaB [SAR202 cluster bacterium]|nr:tRNA (N(6)-L-threonylcarbamoyladenosine(37)-C(2))-methylthiotransferase MtaB [SAR202 cluster bacterium]|tara:strand:+ start:22793 stop:24067 length:1275 start_codon:yes stop_codon:yes gene_type:complete
MPTTSTTPPQVTIETHGCKLNQADSTTISNQFTNAGYVISADITSSEYFVLNTCTVTHIADRKARKSIRNAKRTNPDIKVIVTGCYAENASAILNSMPEVDHVIGNTNKTILFNDLLNINVKNHKNTPLNYMNNKSRLMVKIQEGCDQICAYCIIPKVRGREKSVDSHKIIDIINESRSIQNKEVVLTGTELGSYGFEFENQSLSTLLKSILDKTDIPRLRVSSLQPQEITDDLLSNWNNSRLCPHFHISLQSGNERILKSMRRKYTLDKYSQTIDLIRRRIPNASITTDVIVGFPGETEDTFNDTYKFCESMGFSSIHVFPYSSRPGTSAFYFKNLLNPELKSEFVKSLISLSLKLEGVHLKTNINKPTSVLWEKTITIDNNLYYTGLSENYIKCLVSTPLDISNTITHIKPKSTLLTYLLAN